MSAKYLLDSTILIDHLNGILKATEWLSKLEDGEACISAVTRAEVLVRAGPLAPVLALQKAQNSDHK